MMDKDIAILHEGNEKNTHDKGLLILLLGHLSLDENKVKFFDMGNKTNFFEVEHENYIELKNDVKDEKIDKILFMIDADCQEKDEKYGGYQNTETELKKIIETLGFERTKIYITCDPDTKEGYLESLFLSSAPDEYKKCVEDFLECSEFKDRESQKAIWYHIYKKAYPQDNFNFKHENFDELKRCLKWLFEEVGDV